MLRVCGLSTCGSGVRRLAVGCVIALTLLAAWAAPRLVAQSDPVATLVWDPVTGASGYIVYWGSASRTYSNAQDVGPNTHWQIPTPASGSVYIVVVAYDADGQISQPSGEIVNPAENPNRAPQAGDDVASTNEDTPSAPINVTANDTDPDGDALTVTNAAVTTAGRGSVAINANNTLTFTPAPNWNGTVTISYRVIDGRGGFDDAFVLMTVNPVNDAPKAVDDTKTVSENSTDNQIAVLANDTDIDDLPTALTVSSVTDPPHGSVTVGASGILLYTPDPGYNGPDSFVYTVRDAGGLTDIGDVSITVQNVNDPPVASDDAYTAQEDVQLVVAAPGVLNGDTDPDGDSLTVLVGTTTTHGTLAVRSDGSFTYTPEENYSGADSFTYTVSDGKGGTDIGAVTIAVNAVNDAPVADSDSHEIAEDAVLTVGAPGVLDGDTDVDSSDLTAVLASGPAHGQLTLNADGSFTYTPNANYNGSDSFTYKANDGAADSNVATVTIAVTPVNDAPTVVDRAHSTDEDTPLTIAAPGVLTGASDLDSDTLTAALVAGPTAEQGTVSVSPDGGFTFTPALNFNGPITFTYKANDGTTDSNVATVTIAVNAVNDAPVADNDSYTIAEDAVLTVEAPGVLDGDTDVEKGPLTAALVAGPAHGTLELNANGAFTYTPAANFSGADSFTYKATDGTADSAAATVSITVTGVNDAPVAANDSYSTSEDDALSVAAPGVLGNDSDEETRSLTAALVTNVTHGTLVLNGDGSFSYTPAANYSGSDSFTYTANDGESASNTATVTITVTGVNDPPAAVDDAATVAEDSGATAIDVLANDTDADADTRTITAVSQGANGAVAITGGGTGVTYTPQADFAGSDSFTYTVSDGNGGNATATVAITVTAVNDAPVAANDAYTTNEDVVLTVMAPTVLANDTDVDGTAAALKALVVATTTNGTLTLNENGSFSYTPHENFNGTDRFTYKANDGALDSTEATVTITVEAVNDGPTAQNDSASTNEDVAVDIPVLANDSDPDGGTVSLSTVGTPANGTAAANADGTIKYTPKANYFGSDSFTYTISDGQGSSATATVTVSIASVNDTPTAADDAATTSEDVAVDIAVLANDNDPDGGTVSVSSVGAAANGTASLNADGTIKYTPNQNYFGSDSFSYTVSDGQGGTATATVTVSIGSVNDGPDAVNDAARTDEDVAVDIAVLANDTDPDGGRVSVESVADAPNGTTSVNPDGTVKYTPAANYFGPDTFSYTITDDQGGTATASVTVMVESVNDAPAAEDDSYATDEDVALTIAAPGVLANDSDVENSALTAVQVTGPANGTLTLNPNGSFTYTPKAGFSGSDSFTYRANDGALDSNVATVTIAVNAVNDAPVAENDSYATDEDTALTIAAPGVLGNDEDADTTTLTAVQVTGPANGTLALNADGSFTYTPNAGYNGTDSFTYRASDGTLQSNAATVTLTVRAVNDGPAAENDSYTTDEDVALTIAAPGVLGNDEDADSATLTAIQVSGPADGSLTLHADGSFTYTPAAGFSGTDSFTYRANDGALDSNVATVTITVKAVNDAPVAENDSYATDEDVALTVPAPGILGNDTDADGAATFTAAPVAGPAHGTLVLNANGSFTYTPNAGYNGADSFTYRANDGTADSNIATVTITINSVNDAPTAVDDAATTAEDTAVDVAVLANDNDPDGGTLSVTGVSAAAHGSAAVNANGTVKYTPNANYFGADSFTYTIGDGQGASATATVTVSITGVNDAPVAADDSFSTLEDTAVSGNVLTNDTDIDGGTLTATLGTGAAKGTLVLNADGSFTYTPNLDFTGTDTFTYTVSDGNGGTDTGTVTILINEVNDAPVARGDAYEVNEDATLHVVLPGVLGNDTDTENSPLTAVLVSNPANGTLTLNPNGSFTYQPNANYHGLDAFTYKANDGTQDSNIATVSIQVNPVNDAPDAVDDTFATTEDMPVSGNVLSNDTDLDGDTVTAALGTAPSSGTVALNADGSFTYTPNLNFSGSDTFTYTARNATEGSDSATVTITVTAANDAPLANADAVTVAEDSADNHVDVLANDTDADADTLTVTAVTQGTNGAVAVAAGRVTYTPNPNYAGSDTFTYTIDDGNAGTATATVTVTVTAVNDNPVANADTASVVEDSANNPIDVLGNDADVDGDPLSVTAVTQAENGSVALTAGIVSYTPNPNFVGSDSFSYTISDGHGGTATANVTVTVTNANDAPVANDDTATVAEDSASNAIPVLANDTDLDGDTLSVTAVTQGANGSVVLAAGAVSYTPTPNFVGSDSFGYTITDGNGGSDSATVTVTVTNVNDAPVATPDAATVVEDSVNNLIDVVANDTDPDDDALTIAAVTQGLHGSVAVASGGVSYTPNPNYAGVDTFTYTIADGQGGSATANVTVAVSAVNDSPIANDDTASIAEDSGGNLIGVLANDTDLDGDALTIAAVTQGSHGSVIIAAGGVSYTPGPNFVGSDTFTYTINDGNGGSDSATVTVAVTNANDAPVANADAATVAEDSLNTPINVVTNDTDADGDTLTVTAVTQGTNGSVAIAGSAVTYTPNPNYFGPDSFTYTIADGNGGTATAAVAVTVTPVNDSPVANADSANVAEDSANNAIAVLANDTDIDGDSLTITAVTQGANGTVAIAGSAVSYTPNANFVGSDSFSYTIGDGHGGTATANVTVTVNNGNDAPVANDDAANVNEDSANNAIAVQANDTDPDGDTLSVTAVTQAANGSVVLAAGVVSYTPNPNFTGTDSFTYTISDSNGGADSATVTVTVANANDAPVANPDAATVAEDSANNAIDVLANDTDADGDTLTIDAVTQGAHGSVTSAGGGVTYTPNPDYAGPDSFSYTIGDGHGGSATANVAVTVTGVNDAPVAADDVFATTEDTPVSGNVLANDTDGDNGTLTAALGTGPARGVLALNADGSFTYTPNANFSGTDSFTYTVTDGNGGSDSATATITVSAVNDAPVANDDSATVGEDSGASAIQVLANDVDPDGDALTITAVSQGLTGSVSIAGSVVTYTPNLNFIGSDSFTYTISDGHGGTATATVNVAVTPTNDPPVANGGTFTTMEDTPVSGNVLANDDDIDEDTLTAALVAGPSNGVLVLNSDGSFTYTPNLNFSGTDGFTYAVSDVTGASDSATVSITVNAVNDAPAALDDAAMTSEDTPVNGNVLANDTDAEGDALSAVLVDAPGAAAGMLVLAADGSFSFTPAADFNGAAVFTYRATDGTATSNLATVTIGVTPANDAPVAHDDNYFARDGALLILDAPGVLGNDTDVDSALTATVVNAPAHGELTMNGDGSFTYMPAAGFTGTDSFTYQANDGSVSSNTATVTILVASELVVGEVGGENRTVTTDPEGTGPTPEDPVEASVTSPVDGTITLADTAPLMEAPAGYSFLGQQVVITAPVATAAQPLVLVFVLDGSIVPPGHNENTIVVFRNGSPVAACVADAGSAASPNPCVAARELVNGDVRLSIRTSQASVWNFGTSQVNEAPVANDDAYSANENDILVIDMPGVLGNDTDAERNTLTAVKVTNPANGTLTLDRNGSFTYTPNAGFNGTDSFTYKVTDSRAESNVATVTITVKEVNHAPVAAADQYSVAEDGSLTQVAPGVLANDSDSNGHALTAAVVGAPVHGTLALNADGSFTYTPAADFNGTDVFSYRASDGEATDTATVSITVTAVNDTPAVTNPGAQQDAVGNVVSLQIAAKDVDGDKLSFSAAGLPGGLSISTTGLISGTANVGGIFDVTVTVSDGTEQAQASFKWTVQDKLALVNPGAQVSMERDRVQLKIEAVLPARDRETADLRGEDDNLDDDYDDYDRRFRTRPRLRFYATGLPKGLKIHKRTGIIHGRLDDQSAGIYQVVVWARLGEAKASTAFLWTVRPFNYPPQIRDIDDQVDRAGDRIELDLKIGDRDDENLTVTVEGLPEGLRYDAEEGAIIGTIPRTGSAGEYTVVIKVSDGTTETTATFDWIIRALRGY